MRGARSIGTWFAEHPWVVSVIALSAALIIPGILQRHSDEVNRNRDRAAAVQVITDRARQACETRNAGTNQLRVVGIQSDVAIAQANTEALLLAAQQLSPNPPSEADANVLRQITIEQATAASTAIYNQLTLEDCKAVERDARREAERTLAP